MASHALQQNHQDVDTMIKIWNDVVLSPPSTGDAQAMHSTILAMVSSRLERAFRNMQRRDANQSAIEPLLQAIKESSHYKRSSFCSLQELEQWTNAPHSTINTALRHTVQQLSQWANTSAIQPNPPSYTHRQVYGAVSILGACKALRAIVEEVKAQTEAGNGASALDVGVSIICAPTVLASPIAVDWAASSSPAPPAQRTSANLREMLKQEFDLAANLVATDPLLAETIVRLHRRVEAQLASIGEGALQGAPNINIPSVHLGDIQSQGIPDDINKAIDDAAAASIVDDISSMDNKALQRSMDELANSEGIDLTGIGMGAGDGDASGMQANLGNLPGLDLSEMGGMGMDMDMDMGMDMGGGGGGGGDDDWGLDFDNM